MTKHSKLLIDEPPLQVLPSLAKAIGLEDSIMLQQIHYWLPKAEHVDADGTHWVHKTIKEWQDEFPWLSESTIWRILDRLTKAGLVLKATLSDDLRDRTRYYTIDHEALEALVLGKPSSTPDYIPSSQPDQIMSSTCLDDPSIQRLPTETTSREGAGRARQSKEITEDFINELVTEHAHRLGGEQAVRDSIEYALNHAASKKWIDKRLGLKGWLRRETPKPIHVATTEKKYISHQDALDQNFWDNIPPDSVEGRAMTLWNARNPDDPMYPGWDPISGYGPNGKNSHT